MNFPRKYAPAGTGAMWAAADGSAAGHRRAGVVGPFHAGATSAVVKIEGQLTEDAGDKAWREILAAPKPLIRVVIDSNGGLVAAGDKICRAIAYASRKSMVVGYAGRRCSSAAFDILVACSHRVATASTEFVLHRMSQHREDLPHFVTARDMRRLAATMEERDADHMRTLCRRFPLSASEIAIIGVGDLYLSPERALEIGIVDRVLDRLPPFLSRKPDGPLELAKRHQAETRMKLLSRVRPGQIMGL